MPSPVITRHTPSARGLLAVVSASHQAQAEQQREAPAVPVGKATKDHGTDGHAEQLGSQHITQCGPVDAPLLHDAVGRHRDYQHIEAVHRIEQHGKADNHALQCCH